MRKKILCCGLLVALSAGLAGNAYASCGSATCPLNSHHYLSGGRMHLMFAHEYIDQDQIYTGSKRSFVGALPNNHDEVETVNRRSLLNVQYAVTDAIALNAEIPFIQRKHNHLEDGVNETFSFSGFGDIVVGGQYAVLLPAGDFDPYVSLQAGVKLPTGMTTATSDGGEAAEVTLQPGTGSLDAIVGLNFRQNLVSVPTFSGEFAVLPLTAGVSYQMNGKGTNDYRMGNTLLAYLGTQYQLSTWLSVLLQVNGMFRDYADVGSTGEFRRNTGGTWIFVSPGLSFQLNGAISAFGYLQLPVYRNVHGIQQTSPMNLQVGLSADFTLFQ